MYRRSCARPQRAARGCHIPPWHSSSNVSASRYQPRICPHILPCQILVMGILLGARWDYLRWFGKGVILLVLCIALHVCLLLNPASIFFQRARSLKTETAYV
ncbi:hypothetical protein F4802DRAFT_173036 [Xylaria palmicola]|nr:hypothetical protein F4802DRAFT_173036 [Xylaria palmicola]